MYYEISVRDLIIRTEEEKNYNCQGESFVTVVALRRAGSVVATLVALRRQRLASLRVSAYQ